MRLAGEPLIRWATRGLYGCMFPRPLALVTVHTSMIDLGQSSDLRIPPAADAPLIGVFKFRKNHCAVGVTICTMGKVLEQAVAELSKLPETEQEAAGAWILA